MDSDAITDPTLRFPAKLVLDALKAAGAITDEQHATATAYVAKAADDAADEILRNFRLG